MADENYVPFSERHGYVHRAIQIKSMDAALRNGLWNALSRLIPIDITRPSQKLSSTQQLMRHIWIDHFKETEDVLPQEYTFGGLDPAEVEGLRSSLKKRFYTTDWHRVYDLIEFVGRNIVCNTDQFRRDCNFVLERERAGYRFVNRLIVPITNDLEIEEIETAMEGQKEPADHLRDALKMLSDRQAPNYRDSLEESIKAVESQARKTLNSTDTLGQLSSRLTRQLDLPTPLTTGLSKIYGYSSDQVRHGRVGTESEVDFHLAKFMLVACSAFVNLIATSAEQT